MDDVVLESAVSFALAEAFAVWKQKGGEPLTNEEVADLVARAKAAATAEPEEPKKSAAKKK